VEFRSRSAETQPAAKATERLTLPAREYRCGWCKSKLNEAEHRQYLKQRAEEAELKRRERERGGRLRKEEGWWKQLDGRTFERELADPFRGKGYRVRWTGRPGDQGVDLRLEGMGKTIITYSARRIEVGLAQSQPESFMGPYCTTVPTKHG
jgi:hypothetical protein